MTIQAKLGSMVAYQGEVKFNVKNLIGGRARGVDSSSSPGGALGNLLGG